MSRPQKIGRIRRTTLLLGALLMMIAALMFDISCSQSQHPTLEVTPLSATLVSGQTTKIEVTRRFPNGPAENITDHVNYTSSSRNVASVDARGLVTAGQEAGSVVVRIFDVSSDASALVNITVTAPRIESIEVAPNIAIVMLPGTQRLFSATAHLNNGVVRDVTSTVIWASSNENAATVGRTPADFGRVTALAEGDTTISATDTNSVIQGRTIVFVRGQAAKLTAVVVNPNPATVAVGGTQQFGALGVFSDGTSRDVTPAAFWASSNTGVATIDAKGLMTGVAIGDTTITASSQGSTPSPDADAGAEAGADDAGIPEAGTPTDPDASTGPEVVRGSAAAKVQ